MFTGRSRRGFVSSELQLVVFCVLIWDTNNEIRTQQTCKRPEIEGAENGKFRPVHEHA